MLNVVEGAPRIIDSAAKVCLLCGSCLQACPVYKRKLIEMVSPRGKMALAEATSSGQIRSRRAVAAYLSQCLVCAACMEECPNDLDVDARMIAARSALSKELIVNLPFFAAFRTVLQKRSLMDLLVFFGRVLGRALFFKVPQESGMHLRFPLLVPRDRLLPPIARRSFLKSTEIVKRATPSDSALSPFSRRSSASYYGEVGRIAYFVGCMANYSCTNVAKRLLELVPRDQARISVPLDQKCCGMPAIVAGDLTSARKLARHNINVLLSTDAERIVVTCASCGSAIKHYYPLLFADDPGARASAEDLASRVIDVSELLVDELGFKSFKVDRNLLQSLRLDPSKPVKVTYHQPCHLGRKMKVVAQPKTILERTEGIQFVPMQDESVCCGCGGLFSVHHYDLSSSITADKVENIKATGAQIVATGCPACMMQLADGLAHARHNIPVVHTIQLIEPTGR